MSSKTRFKTEKLDPPQTVEEARDILRLMGRAETKLNRLKEEFDRDIQARALLYTDETAPILERQERDTLRLQAFFEANAQDLLKGTARSVKWPEGQIGYRKDTISVHVENEIKIIAQLKGCGLGTFIKVSESLDKTAIARNREGLSDIEGLSFKAKVNFFVKPAEAVTRPDTIDVDNAPVIKKG